MKMYLRVQLVLIILVAVAGAVLKSGQSSARPVHKMLGALAAIAGIVSVVQAFRLKANSTGLVTISAIATIW
jgi:hypothetical protein